MTEEAPCVGLDQELEEHTDDGESECDPVYSETIKSKPEGEEVNDVEQQNTVEELDKMQYSVENLVWRVAFIWMCHLLLVTSLLMCYWFQKSSGSSSFTEITLTEVKEEDVMFRSATPQVAHTCTMLQTDHAPVVLHCGMCSVILTYSYLITPSECLFIFSSVDCLKSALIYVIFN